MGIDMGTVIVGGIILIICVLPFALTTKNNRKRKTQILKTLNQLVVQHKSEVNSYEAKTNFAIGIDEVKGLIFFIRQLKNGKIETKCLELIKIKTCKVNRENSTGNQVERLSLIFIHFNEQKNNEEMEFYNIDINLQLDGELQMVERWAVIINNQLNTIIR